jgi:hypothetical protein
MFNILRFSVNTTGLGFVVRKDMDDLHFWLEHLDKRVEKIESLLLSLLLSLQSLELATSAPTTSEAFFL